MLIFLSNYKVQWLFIRR